MRLPVNKFKKALHNPRPQYGLWMGLPDTTCAEICAGAGFDWLLIDCEHAPYSVRGVQNQLQAIAPYEVPAIVRPTEGSTAELKRLLDVGAQTFLVPMVNTAEHARQLVKAVRYPPEGVRGLGTSMARAAHWNGIENYLLDANREICLIVQVETVEALENLPDIAAVEGVDGVFIGPSDLSASMGYIGQPAHPEVKRAVLDGFKTIADAGKAVGILAVTKVLAKDYAEHGADFIGVGVDASLLAGAVRNLAAQYCGERTLQTLSAGY